MCLDGALVQVVSNKRHTEHAFYLLNTYSNVYAFGGRPLLDITYIKGLNINYFDIKITVQSNIIMCLYLMCNYLTFFTSEYS